MSNKTQFDTLVSEQSQNNNSHIEVGELDDSDLDMVSGGAEESAYGRPEKGYGNRPTQVQPPSEPGLPPEPEPLFCSTLIVDW
ncbi:hypothetical protein ACE1CI_31325 [Aerosakkonemataceae cyanobacterium BLCC-F50]|uniref:Uncharacterized protein n=1 Tax=Floridaenema flaviceps BLCC-F50 TaxID=3153642 RepID=A0ABV4Y150_9CYAN